MSRIIVFRDGTVEGQIDHHDDWWDSAEHHPFDACPVGGYYWHTGDWFKPKRDPSGGFDTDRPQDDQVPASLRAYVLLNGTMT